MSEKTTDIERIVPERALQNVASNHDVAVDALRADVRHDLERNKRMEAEISEQRPLAYEADDYEVYIASDAVTTETTLPVLHVYRGMDDSETDYQNGYALVVPTLDDGTDDPDVTFQSAAEAGENDE